MFAVNSEMIDGNEDNPLTDDHQQMVDSEASTFDEQNGTRRFFKAKRIRENPKWRCISTSEAPSAQSLIKSNNCTD